eukprot:scaffold134045_cov15-Prasinocladus_malaysianus.AAC.1
MKLEPDMTSRSHGSSCLEVDEVIDLLDSDDESEPLEMQMSRQFNKQTVSLLDGPAAINAYGRDGEQI